jgi:hypothetical protein
MTFRRCSVPARLLSVTGRAGGGTYALVRRTAPPQSKATRLGFKRHLGRYLEGILNSQSVPTLSSRRMSDRC